MYLSVFRQETGTYRGQVGPQLTACPFHCINVQMCLQAMWKCGAMYEPLIVQYSDGPDCQLHSSPGFLNWRPNNFTARGETRLSGNCYAPESGSSVCPTPNSFAALVRI